MIESLFITLFPFFFLILLFSGEKIFRDKGVDQGGEPPINKALFVSSKYSIVLLWIMMIIQSWGVDISMIRLPVQIRYISLALWFVGFIILFSGRLGLGDSFRIGEPKEQTGLKTHGLFRFSRNPMYLGVYMTILAVILFTSNIFVLILAIYILAIHHMIVLAEERFLRKKFGKEYRDYCARVRRYI
jgi:protein-S-isoprenylcysteine O-methyltransferase Ste14